MKIATRQISGFVTGQVRGTKGALVFGIDEGQAREHATAITKTLGIDAKDPFSFVELSEEALKAEPTRLHDELFALNMLGGPRLVRVQASSDGVGKLLDEIYDGKQAQLPEAYLLVVAGELTTRSLLRSVFETHPQLAAIACYKDEAPNVAAMVQQTLSHAQIRFNRDVVDYLAANMGSDRHVTRGELEKIVLFCGENGSLSLEDAASLVGNSADIGMDDLSEALADGQIRRSDTVMQKLLKEAVQPIQIIRALQRYFLRLHLLASQIAQDRISVTQAVANAKPKVFYKQVPVLERQLHSWKLPMLEKALTLLTAAERASKSTGNDAEAQLQHYVTEILSLFHKARKVA